MKYKNRILQYLILCILSMIVLAPIVFMVVNSFMSSNEILSRYGMESGKRISLTFIPNEVTLIQYYKVLLRTPEFLMKFWNSCKLVIAIVTGQAFICIPAAYVFAKFEFPFKRQLTMLIIIIMVLPYQATLVPNYIILKNLKLLGGISSIMIPGIFSALGMFIISQFMKSIPNDQIEAAEIDGASHLVILLRIIIPQCKGGIISFIILSFADNWNMVEQPIIFLNRISEYPLSVFLSKINNEDLGIAFVCGVIYMVPAILLFLLGQKYLLSKGDEYEIGKNDKKD